MTLEELRVLAKPGSQLEIFVQGLDARLPFPEILFAVNIGADLFQARFIALAEALYDRGRYDDTDDLYDRYPQLN